eukprot:TRINITY_DN7765_c0_g1_i2.p1 TRINITY_DN7765_c0_g1~~TRINITY_DN7765_c0_g1_i2.p1  ORF type:complete len:754 (+),score=178.86 TRINITY_DN7765_c0_g1_i2:74-2263(+)
MPCARRRPAAPAGPAKRRRRDPAPAAHTLDALLRRQRQRPQPPPPSAIVISPDAPAGPAPARTPPARSERQAGRAGGGAGRSGAARRSGGRTPVLVRAGGPSAPWTVIDSSSPPSLDLFPDSGQAPPAATPRPPPRLTPPQLPGGLRVAAELPVVPPPPTPSPPCPPCSGQRRQPPVAAQCPPPGAMQYGLPTRAGMEKLFGGAGGECSSQQRGAPRVPPPPGSVIDLTSPPPGQPAEQRCSPAPPAASPAPQPPDGRTPGGRASGGSARPGRLTFRRNSRGEVTPRSRAAAAELEAALDAECSYDEERYWADAQLSPPPPAAAATYLGQFMLRRSNALQRWLGVDGRDFAIAQDCKAGDGAKMFCVIPRGHVHALLAHTPAERRCFYAVVPPDVPVDVYIDLDHRPAEGSPPGATQGLREPLLLLVLQRLSSALRNRYGVRVESAVVLDATTPAKVSFHVHARLDGRAAFASAQHLQSFLKALYASASWASPAFGLEVPEGALHEAACASVDTVPYSRYACFRLPLCSKRGKNNTLLPLAPSGIADPELRALLRQLCPPRSAIELVDACLISRVEAPARLRLLEFNGSADCGSLRPAPQQRRTARAAAGAGAPPLEAAAPDVPQSDPVHGACLRVFRAVAAPFAGLRAADVRVKHDDRWGFQVLQRGTTWCPQQQRAHRSATTSLSLRRDSVSMACWSSHCPRRMTIGWEQLLPADAVREVCGILWPS